MQASYSVFEPFRDRGLSSRSEISFYRDPPSEEVSLEEFERFAVDRLVMLRYMEKRRQSNDHNTVLDNQYTSNVTSNHRADIFGHFILRLAFARNPDHRIW